MAAKVNLKPIGGNILVKPIEEETKTDSGIVLPETVSKEKKQKGTIIALGTGRKNDDGEDIPFNVEEGQTVLYKQYGPDEVEIDGEEYLIMEESDILAVVTE
jgi:chaperonin GroES